MNPKKTSTSKAMKKMRFCAALAVAAVAAFAARGDIAGGLFGLWLVR